MNQSLLGNRTGCLAHVPVLILRGQLCGLSRAHHRIKFDRDPRRFARFIRRAGGSEKLLVRVLLLPDAEHVLSDFSLVIALRETLPGKDGFELFHIFFRDALAVDRRAVGLRHNGHVLGPLHAPFDLHRRNAHAL